MERIEIFRDIAGYRNNTLTMLLIQNAGILAATFLLPMN